MNNVCSEVSLARQGKLKRHDGSEVNAMAAKTSVKTLLPSLHDMSYPYLQLCILQAILEGSTFAIAIINVTFYYSTMVRLEREVSGLHNSWNSCSILGKCSRNDLRRPEI